jgi:plastocyanin
MAIQLMIRINRNTSVTFSPDPLSANTLDQIFWVNNDDSEPHWPGLVKSDGTINPTFFMANQIAPGGDSSPIFSPSTAATLDYACSLHQGETGSIIIS